MLDKGAFKSIRAPSDKSLPSGMHLEIKTEEFQNITDPVEEVFSMFSTKSSKLPALKEVIEFK
jgi:hypothetical protein